MGKLWAKGVNQGDLNTALREILTDWNATLALLDADTGVTAANFVSVCAIAAITNIDTFVGAEQTDIVSRLQAAVTSINAVNAKLDADGLTYTDYAAKYDVTDTINSTTYSTGIFDSGIDQGDLINMLYDLKTNMNAVMAYLDADGTVNTATYVSSNTIGFEIDTTGA